MKQQNFQTYRALRIFSTVTILGLAALVVIEITPNGLAANRAFTAGHPAHNHIGNTYWSQSGSGGKLYGTCNSCIKSGDTVKHIEKELNFFVAAKLPNYTNTVSENNLFTSDEAQAVKDYQALRGIKVDGVVGNQTLAQMESDVFGLQTTFRLNSGTSIRLAMWDACRGFTAGINSVFIPIKTRSEYNSFVNNRPSDVSTFTADCNVSGVAGGSGGGGGGGSTGGGGVNCALICNDSVCGYPICQYSGCTPLQCNKTSSCIC